MFVVIVDAVPLNTLFHPIALWGDEEKMRYSMLSKFG